MQKKTVNNVSKIMKIFPQYEYFWSSISRIYAFKNSNKNFQIIYQSISILDRFFYKFFHMSFILGLRKSYFWKFLCSFETF